MDTSLQEKKIEPSKDTDKPGALALAVVDELKDDVFKKPFPVVGTKRKVEVLDEETYLDVSQ